MSQDNNANSSLNILGVKERKMLEKLAELSGRTPIAELNWLVRSRALGHLKDLGDDRGNFRVYESDLRSLAVDEAEFHK